MSLESQVAELVNKTSQLLQRVTTQADEWDAQVQAKINELEVWRQNAKLEFGIPFRHNVSQRLIGSDLSEQWQGWTIPSYLSIEPLLVVHDNVPWENRTEEEKELLTAMGRSGIRYIFQTFAVHKISWENVDLSTSKYTPYFQVPCYKQKATFAAFIKVVSGAIKGSRYHGWELGKWKLCGIKINCSEDGYWYTHDYLDSPSGLMYIALPAFVYGDVDLTNPSNWWIFPSFEMEF